MKRISFTLGLTILLTLFLGCPSAITPTEATYRVSYNENGATSGATPTDNQPHALGSVIPIPGNTGELVKTGYSFVGWNLKADGSGNSYIPGAALFMPAADIILYASWDQNPSVVSTYSLTYDGNGATSGTVPIDTGIYKAGDITQVQNNSGALTRAGYYFVGWSTKSDGSGYDYSPGATLLIPAANLTLYAIWTATTSATATFSVTYVVNGATGNPPEDLNSYHQYDSILVSSSQGTMVKPGYILAGWMTAVDGTGTSYAQGSRLSMGTVNIQLWAIWIPSTLTFTASESRITLTGYVTQPSGAWSCPVGVTNFGPLDGVVALLSSAVFGNCINLSSVTFPPSLVSIAPGAFWGCTSLTTINFPTSLTTIGDRAFLNCTSLTSITLPAKLKSIHPKSFSGCSSLTTITVDAANDNYGTDSGVLYDKTFNNLLFAPAKLTGTLTIPVTVTAIADNAFYGCTSLTAISIPNSVASIGNAAFQGCTSLSSLTIPSAVTKIGTNTFYGCTSLTTLTLPNTVTALGNYAIYHCTSLTSLPLPSSLTTLGSSALQSCTGLTAITIPASVTTMDGSVFYGCTNLAAVTVLNPTPPTTTGGDFSSTSASLQISVPAASVAAYQAATGWSAYSAKIISL